MIDQMKIYGKNHCSYIYVTKITLLPYHLAVQRSRYSEMFWKNREAGDGKRLCFFRLSIVGPQKLRPSHLNLSAKCRKKQKKEDQFWVSGVVGLVLIAKQIGMVDVALLWIPKIAISM